VTNLRLRHQIFLSYLVMIALTVIVGGYAIWSLTELNNITTEIVFSDLLAGETMGRLTDSLQAQDLYEKRFLALGQQEAESLFWSRSKQFRIALSEIPTSDESLKKLAENAASNHEKYDQLFMKEARLVRAGKTRDAEELSQDALKTSFAKVASYLRDLDIKVRGRQNLNVSKSSSLSERALTVTTVLSAASLFLGLLFASLLTSHLTTSIGRLKEATRSIRSGDFDNFPDIRGADELSDLAMSFREMSSRLKELEALNLDASPLTKLPGNLAIEKELLIRLNETQKFSFCLVDLDNFKAFNDRYGYARGSDVIKWLGELISSVKKEVGAVDDFLGHIGGDDFVLICEPGRVAAICSKIIEEFDRGIGAYYDPEDLQKGCIVSIDRNDQPAVFGIMTISIAVVNTDRTLVRDVAEISTKATELKQYAKTFAKSLYIIDRRRSR